MSGKMKGINFSSTLFFLLLTSVLATATPLQPPSGNTALNLLLPTNASKLTSPTPPQDYGILLKFDESIVLNPLGVYINAIELMYRLAQYNWDAHIYEEIRMSVTFYNIWILAAGAPSDRLQVSHIVIALQDCIIAMARLTGFFRLSALISLDGEMIGHLEFGNNQSPSDNNTSVSLQEDSSLLVNNNRSDGSSINSGHIVDPNDHRFVITYDFYEKAIDSKEIFTVVLDGLATSAQFEPNEYCDVLEVHSMSGTVAISITKILGEPTLVRYYDLTRSLLIIVTGVIVRQRMFRELGFSISYNGLEIAEGYLFKVTLANNGTQERPQLQKRR